MYFPTSMSCFLVLCSITDQCGEELARVDVNEELKIEVRIDVNEEMKLW